MDPDPDPELTVVICTRNRSSTIGDQLRALAEQRCDVPWEVLVVDNGSTDDTVAVVRAIDLGDVPLRVVDASDRAGLSHARNVGVREARADAIAFCDDDDLVGRGWVAAMARDLRHHPLVASALEYERLNPPELLVGRSRFQSTGVEHVLGFPVCSGPCGVRRELWEELGGNDEDLDGTGEDFDFAMRAHRLLGVTAHFSPDAVYHYRLRDEPGGVFRQARAYGRSHVQLWARHDGRRIAPAPEWRRAGREWWWIATRAPLALAGRHWST
jgi:glycosyltransferase involved in cell wall biosynthesis